MRKKPYNKWSKDIRHLIIRLSGPKPFCLLQTVSKIKRLANVSICRGKLSANGENGSLMNVWPVYKIVQGAAGRVFFPPKVVMEVKALACQLPSERDLPLSRLSHADIAREAVRNGIVASISGATVWRWLSNCRYKTQLYSVFWFFLCAFFK